MPKPVSGGLAFVQLGVGGSVGAGHMCGRVSSGALYCWGYNPAGELGDGTLNADHFAPTPSDGRGLRGSLPRNGNFDCGRTAAGTAYCWGEGLSGQIGDGGGATRKVPNGSERRS